MKRNFFIDFDGTVTKVDTVLAMDEAFAHGDWLSINEMWRRREISTETCANMKFEMYRASMDDVQRLINAVEIDDYFKYFIDLCKKRGFRVYILSDGYDFNIETLFKKYGITLPYYANHLMYEYGSLRLQPLYPNPSCGHCGTCKSLLMSALKEEKSQAIYIGDGYSDLCPATQADLVYAKGSLYRLCLEAGVVAIEFKDFSDVISGLSLFS
jgi:2,3-diketo-5-methylthio-1-phosphopentane phosphatase